MRVNYGQSVHGEDEIAAVVNVLRNSTQMGRSVRSMQERVAALFAKRHGIMVNSGSSANYLAVELLNLPAGSEVITPALTFATTVGPIVRHKLVPAFVDVTEGTYNIDVNAIEKMITPKTRAVMIPSLIGNLPDWRRIREIADAYKLMVVEDSADTLGATLNDTSTGIHSHISTTSFYGSHVINAAGTGGMLCVNDDEFARRATLLRSWGRTSSLFVESENIENRFNIDLDGYSYDAKFVFEELGYNLEPTEVGAAFGLVQLDKLEQNIVAREANFQRQREFFAGYEKWFILPRQLQQSRTGWLAFPLTIRDDAPFTRRQLQIFLEQQDIQTRPVFTGNILRQPAMKGVTSHTNPNGYKVADSVMRGGILLACHHGLNGDQIDYMHETFRNFAKTF
jgi:CDP-4-dehydro-6-deoxyglucose reductase, E1